MESEKENLRNFIQVVQETGISVDYLNEFEALWCFKIFGLEGSDEENWDKFWSSEKGEYFRTRNQKLVRRYEECYPPNCYDYSRLSEDTKGRIKRLDEIADKASDLFASGKFTRQEFSEIFLEANKITYGENRKEYMEEKKLHESEFGKKV